MIENLKDNRFEAIAGALLILFGGLGIYGMNEMSASEDLPSLYALYALGISGGMIGLGACVVGYAAKNEKY
jgi:hypothetical protein